MPFKDKSRQKEANRESMARVRDTLKERVTHEGLHKDGRTWGNVYPKQQDGTIERVEGASGYYWRDGLRLPRPFIPNWEQEGYKDATAQLKAIAEALDKSVAGLEGKENLGNMVRYGVHGPTLTELGKVL